MSQELTCKDFDNKASLAREGGSRSVVARPLLALMTTDFNLMLWNDVLALFGSHHKRFLRSSPLASWLVGTVVDWGGRGH